MAKYNIKEKKEKSPVYRTLVSDEVLERLKARITEEIVVNQKYKVKEYSAAQLARDLNTNTRYISAAVNVCFGVNYSEFVNKFRVRDAKSILADKRYNPLGISDVADIVGFSNRQSFYAAFYRFTGVTPRKYRIESQGTGPNDTPVGIADDGE